MARRSFPFALVFFCACAREPNHPVSDTPATTTSARVQSAELSSMTTAEAIQDGIAVAEEIRATCPLPIEPRNTPHFDLDSAQVTPRGATILDAVGACLTAGGLAGRRVVLIGHTDAVGPSAYNQQLGAARALAAKRELERVGVSSEAIDVASRGEAGARGTDRLGRSRDRRVEIRLIR